MWPQVPNLSPSRPKIFGSSRAGDQRGHNNYTSRESVTIARRLFPWAMPAIQHGLLPLAKSYDNQRLCGALAHVCFGPKADLASSYRASMSGSFNVLSNNGFSPLGVRVWFFQF